MANYKGQLQEILMKAQEPLPVYKHTSNLGPEGGITWTTSLTIFGKTFKVESLSKKEGEKILAKKALEFRSKNSFKILKKEPVNPPKFDPMEKLPPRDFWEKPPLKSPRFFDKDSVIFSKKRVLIIDLENLPKLPYELKEEGVLVGSLFTDIYAVCSKHYAGEGHADIEGIKKVLSPSLQTNGSDTCITMMVGAFMASEKYDEYFLASKDKFISPIADIIRGGTDPALLKPKQVHTVSRKEHILQAISSL